MGELFEFEVGQAVELGDGRTAVVRFVGDAHFAPGDWLGVELEDTSGKNDGSVQGQRYFDCEQAHGMFVRPAVAAPIEQPIQEISKPAKRSSAPVNGAAVKSRPSSTASAAGAAKRQSILDPTAKRRSINAGSPTPAARAPITAPRALRSPSKSPTKQLGNASLRNPASSASAKPSTATTKRTSISGRAILVPSVSTAQRTPRPSVGPSLTATTRPSLAPKRQPVGRLSNIQQGLRPDSIVGTSQSGRSDQASSNSHGSDVLSPSLSDGFAQGRPSPTASRGSSSTAALSRELEDLKTKLRLIEKKRLEDREKQKVLEKVQGERDKFENIIQKLQAKYQPQQQEIAELRKQLKNAETSAEEIETERMDIDTAVEMATLDREMAEETAEACKTELETLRSRFEEMELEVEILREENCELGKEMSPEERTSQGWIQMERSNERLREALIRLRDMTQENEAELKDQIQELQRDSQEFGGIQERYDETKRKLDQSETVIEDLKQQLDNALGAEEMIEELSEKNNSLTEQIDELKIVVEDLESLKELNDELEANHVENEKQLQDELDYMEAMQLEQARKASTQDETIEDLEYTISRFRELVTNLTSDLEDMRASQQITETEATELTSRSKAMMDLNLRLRASASKAQSKAIEIEIGRLEAQETADHLSIVQCFLPKSYADDKDSVSAYLRIKRIGFKSSLLYGFMKEKANGVAVPGHEEDVFASCELLDKLTWVSAMCERFVKFIHTCSLESFEKLRGALYELDPVERALNGWIDGLKRDDLKEPQCASELHRSIALMTHLAEVHISQGLQQHAEDLYMRALVMESHLENAAAVVSQVKAITQVKVFLSTDADEDDEATAECFMEKADTLISQFRSAKVIAGKSVNQLKELQSRSLTLDPSSLPSIEQTETIVSDLVEACHTSAAALLTVVNEEGRTDSFTYDEVTSAISLNDSTPFNTLLSKLQIAAVQVQNFYSLTTMLSQTLEFSSPSNSPPWYLLSQRLKAEASTFALHEKEVLRLRDELSEKNTALAMKDKALEESSVNVEVLSKRINDSGGRREKLREVEATIETLRAKERESATTLASVQERLRSLEEERENWTRQAIETSGTGPMPADISTSLNSEFVPAKAQAEIAELKQEMATLQATIRHLRFSTQTAALSSAHGFLAEPLTGKRAPTGAIKIAHEASDVLKSMLELVTSANNKGVVLRARGREERLSWRPARESARWQVGKQREDWEKWCEWRDEVGKKQRAWQSHMTRKDEGRQKVANKPVARIGVRLPGSDLEKMGPKVIRIADAEEWAEVERGLGMV